MPTSNQHSPSSPPQNFTSQTPPQPQYYYFRGHKKRVSEFNKTKMLKTKRVKEKQQKILRYDLGDQEEDFLDTDLDKNQGMQDSKKLEITSRVNFERRAKSQFQIMKHNPVDKLWKMQRIKRNLSSNDNHQLMIRTSRMEISSQQNRNSIKPFQTSTNNTTNSEQPLTRFYSKNLQERMNEYLNMVVAKSSRDHQEKVKKIKEQEEGKDSRHYMEQKEKEVAKMFVKNKFLRELKVRTNLNKKQNQNNLNSNNSHNYNNSALTLRQPQQTTRTQGKQTNRQASSNPINNSKNFSHSRANSHITHNHNYNNITQGQELINFASEVLSKSMKIYGSHKTSRGMEKSLKRLNYSVQVGSGR